MPRNIITKASHVRDKQGRAILGTAKDVATWVRLGFEEQDKNKSIDDPFYKHFIDLRGCVLYVSYPIGSKAPSSQIFNLCDLVDIVPGIKKIENDPDYLFEVTLDIRFDGSLLYGNFFHYVKFDGRVVLDDATVLGSFSCFKCRFDGYVYMQKVHLEGGYTFDQCVFNNGLIMSSAIVGGINAEFNNSTIKERLSLAAASFKKQAHSNPIVFRNSNIENLTISKIKTESIPLYFDNSSIHGMKMDNVQLDGILGFYSCILDSVITSIINEGENLNYIKELALHNCNIKAQYHIENSNIERIALSFDTIEEKGRLRLYRCDVEDFMMGETSVIGQLEMVGNTIATIDLESSCVPGYLNFQGNDVKTFKNRQTLRMLKNEALKVNDEVSAQHLYAEEMKSLLSDKDIPLGDKVSLRLNKLFSDFGESWFKALIITLGFSIILTLFMLGLGSQRYMYNPTGEFIGIGAFVAILLDSINVFSIPLFSETIKAYELNVLGQILYLLIKVLVAYGAYQFIMAFKKHGRK